MKPLFSSFVLILLFTAALYPQSDKAKRIKEIREEYTTLKSAIERIEKSDEQAHQSALAVNELVVNKLNKSWPAVGNYSVVYRFYYEQTGEQHYPETLLMVTKKTVSAARTYYQEYLFEETGELMFYFTKSESDGEHRIYFKDGKLLDYKGKDDRLMAAATTSGAKAKAREIYEMFRLSIE